MSQTNTARRDDNGHNDNAAWRLILALTSAGILAGLLIVLSYQLTLPMITANQQKALQQAVFTVLPEVTTMAEFSFRDQQLIPLSSARTDKGLDTIYAGFDNKNRFIGYAIKAQGPGFQDTITLLYGYQPDKQRIVGMAVVESRETPGLGDKIYKDAKFVANFSSLPTQQTLKAVKKGSKTKAFEIDAITGATISSKAVVRIINNSNKIWLHRLSALRHTPIDYTPTAQTPSVNTDSRKQDKP